MQRGMFGRTTSAKVNVKGVDISASHVRAHSCHLGMLFRRKDVLRGQCPPPQRHTDGAPPHGNRVEMSAARGCVIIQSAPFANLCPSSRPCSSCPCSTHSRHRPTLSVGTPKDAPDTTPARIARQVHINITDTLWRPGLREAQEATPNPDPTLRKAS